MMKNSIKELNLMCCQITQCKTMKISWNYIKQRSKERILVNDVASNLIGGNAILSELRNFGTAKNF